jgi:glycosyltransferase involved in cell wall biosynthesis
MLARHKVFCSLSTLEGGPVPLIESLASGLKIVVTDTGHVRDVLSQIHDYNIIPIDAKVDVVVSALREAIADCSISDQSFEKFDLKCYVETLYALFN